VNFFECIKVPVELQMKKGPLREIFLFAGSDVTWWWPKKCGGMWRCGWQLPNPCNPWPFQHPLHAHSTARPPMRVPLFACVDRRKENPLKFNLKNVDKRLSWNCYAKNPTRLPLARRKLKERPGQAMISRYCNVIENSQISPKNHLVWREKPQGDFHRGSLRIGLSFDTLNTIQRAW